MPPSESIEFLLKKLGPSSSSKIKDSLVAGGLSEEAARQRISRSKGHIRRLTTIKLPRRESFLYLDSQYGSYEFWNSLVRSHTETNSAYGIAMQSIMDRGGAIPKSFFSIVSGSPIKLKKHIASNHILKNLVSCKLLKIENDEELGECVLIDAQGTLDYSGIDALRARLVVEDIIVKAVLEWSRKIGLASYNAIKKRTLQKVQIFGQFGWDITSPSYIFPLAGFDKNNVTPGFIAIDVTNSTIGVEGVKYFIKKCAVNRSIKNMKPFLAMLVAERFSEDAFRLGKSSGIIFTTPEILFGKEIAENIRALSATLENAAATAAKNPDKVLKLFNSLSIIEGAAINLRGALFELIVGHLVYKGEGNSIDIGIKVRNSDGKSAEIDVRRVKGDHQLALYECKGYQPSTKISIDDIDLWLSKKIPIIRDALMQEERFKNTTMFFEYWTSGEFSSEAIELLKKKSNETKKYKIRWKNGSDILNYAREIKSNTMVDTLSQHYLKHPLSK